MFLHWLAGIFTLLGVYVVGRKNKYGFILAIISNLLWIAYVLICGHTYGIMLECLPLLFVNTWNFIKWRRDERKTKKSDK